MDLPVDFFLFIPFRNYRDSYIFNLSFISFLISLRLFLQTLSLSLSHLLQGFNYLYSFYFSHSIIYLSSIIFYPLCFILNSSVYSDVSNWSLSSSYSFPGYYLVTFLSCCCFAFCFGGGSSSLIDKCLQKESHYK